MPDEDHTITDADFPTITHPDFTITLRRETPRAWFGGIADGAKECVGMASGPSWRVVWAMLTAALEREVEE